MSDLTPSLADIHLTAKPYEARQCPECELWVYTNAGPFGEDDPTKTLADQLHWVAEHQSPEEAAGTAIGSPFFSFNGEPVEAVFEARAQVQVIAANEAATAQQHPWGQAGPMEVAAGLRRRTEQPTCNWCGEPIDAEHPGHPVGEMWAHDTCNLPEHSGGAGRNPRCLTVEFYVDGLTDEQVDRLAGEVLAQAGRSDLHPRVTARVVDRPSSPAAAGQRHDHSACPPDAHDRDPGDSHLEEQARDDEGRTLCNDCRQPLMYCHVHDDWDHAEADATPCWLVNR